MTAATHTIPATEKPEPDYAAKRAARVTKREEKERKRQFQFLKDKLRSQLRQQLGQIIDESAKEFLFLLATGHSLQLSVSVRAPEKEEEGVVGSIPAAPEPAKPLIEVVPG